jgi:hypothetical protein
MLDAPDVMFDGLVNRCGSDGSDLLFSIFYIYRGSPGSGEAAAQSDAAGGRRWCFATGQW